MNVFKSNKGFTLIEILVVVTITGIIATTAIAPLVYTIIRVVDTEELYNDQDALQRGIALIINDIYDVMRTADGTLLRTVKEGILGKGDDFTLIVASTAPARQNVAAGSVVYRVIKKSAFSRLHEGLYRWIVPLELPGDIDPEDMDEDEAQLVLTDITNLKIETFATPDWSDEAWSGGLPLAIKISLTRYDKTVERIEWLPQ